MDGYSLAVETSSRQSQIALGRGDHLITQMPVPRTRRHGVELTAAINNLLQTHEAGPAELAQVYVALGPGSFTGLRIGLATVKMLGLSRALGVVGVPSLEVLAAQYPDSLVCLHAKRNTAYCTGPGFPPGLRSIEHLRAAGLPIVGEKIDGATPPHMSVETLWRLGRERATAGRFDDPDTLSPLYIREPEAVTLWRQRDR